jgi:muramoyltetrapeptide carboxypeptidase
MRLIGMKTKIIFILIVTFGVKALAMDNSSIANILGGKKILVVSPASGTSAEELNKLKAIKGLNLSIPSKCFDTSSPFHAASDERRFECLKEAIYDDSSDIIWCLRGGYGSSKIIEKLKTLEKPKKQKLLIGYSDITALHLFFSQDWGWKTIHGTVLIELTRDNKELSSQQKLAKLISGKVTKTEIDNLVPLNDLAKNQHEIKGKLSGGNLTIVETSLGTDWQINSEDKILFFEDTGMKPYQTDRAIAHLKQAGVLKNVKAIIFGAFDKDEEDTINGLKLIADKLKIPIFKTNKFGHDKFNDPVIYNTRSIIVRLDNNNNYKLKMDLRG